MGGYSRNVLLYVAATMVLAISALTTSLKLAPPAVDPSWPTLWALAALAAIAHLYPVRSARKDALFVLADAFVFAGVLLLPAWQVALLCALALLPATAREGSKPGAWVQYGFNTAQSTLAALLAWQVTVRTGALRLEAATDMVWLLAAIVLFIGTQAAMVIGITAVHRRVGLSKVNAISLKDILSDSMTPLLGVILVGLWHAHPWLLALSILPVAFVYRSIRSVHMVSAADFEPKTGLYHFGAFQRKAQEELQRCRAIRRPVSLLFIDLDHLRQVNNLYGHLAGDTAIRYVAGVLVRALPHTAVLSRFGGEEFVALIPGVDREEAYHMAERAREAVQARPCTVRPGAEQVITVSIGVAGSPDDEPDLKKLIDLADQAAYRAKHQGRNRVCLHNEGLSFGAKAEPTVPGGQESPTAAEADTAACAEIASAPQPPHSTWRKGLDLPRLTVVAAGVAAVLLQLPLVESVTDWTPLAVCLAAAVIIEFFPITIWTSGHHTASVSPGVAVGVAAGALLGPGGAVLAGVAGGMSHALSRRTGTPLAGLFNIAAVVLANTASAWVLVWFGANASGPLTGAHLAVGLLATGVNFLVNTAMLALAVGLGKNRSLLRVWHESFTWLMPQSVLMGLAGIFTVFSYRQIGIMGIWLALVPVLIATYTFSLSTRRHQRVLEEARRAQEELEVAHRLQSRTLDEFLSAIATILDARDSRVMGHSDNVSHYAVRLAVELVAPSQEVQSVRLAALLHDLGKIGVPEEILNKPSKLSAHEWSIVKLHASMGEHILSQITGLEDVSRMVGEHHERWDGGGYPYGRQGDGISRGARIISVADTLDTITSGRPYATARPLSWAIDEIKSHAGTQFDPAVVEALIRLFEHEGESLLRRTEENAPARPAYLAVVKP